MKIVKQNTSDSLTKMVIGYWRDWKALCMRLDRAKTTVTMIVAALCMVVSASVFSIPQDTWGIVRHWAEFRARDGMADVAMQMAYAVTYLAPVWVSLITYVILNGFWLEPLVDQCITAQDQYLYASALTGISVEESRAESGSE